MKKSSGSAEAGSDSSLRLDPLHIPNMAPAFEDYAGGIGVALVEDGLKCYVDLWFPNGDGDAIAFYWNNTQTPVWSDTIDANPPDRLRIHLNKGFILEGDAEPVFYSVTRLGQIPVDSPPQKFLVKLLRPGGYDDDPTTPGHSGLRYEVPQEIIDNGVGPIEADAGVDVTILHYENMRKNDRIRLAWGKATVEHTVLPSEENTDITIHVDRATIEAGEDGQVTIAYQVVDVCNNYPDERAPWSAETIVVVDLGGNRLDAPQVLVNGIPTQTIDLVQLAGADVICRVYVNSTDHAVGDTLRLTWVGTPAQGKSQVIVGPLDKTVEYVPFQYDFSIPNADVVAIAKGRASVSYLRIRNGEADRPSNNAPVTVVGDILRPAAPGFVGVTGDTLDPGLNFYTVSIPYYPGRQPGDHLYIVFEGLDASNNPYDFDDNAYVGSEPDGQPVLRNVDKAEIKKLDGGSLTVYYWINSQRRSLELQLSVGTGQPEMEKPDVIEADSNDVLDPDKVNPDVGPNVIVPYTGTVPNDIIGLRWRGSLSSPPDDERPLNTSSAGKPVPFTVPYRYVIDNLNGTVDVDYYLKRGSEPLRYSRVRPLTIGAITAPTLESVKDGDREEIADNTTTQWPNVILSGRAQGNEQVEIFDGGTSLGTVDVPESGHWQYPVNRLLSGPHSLYVEALYGSGLPPSVTRRFTVRLNLIEPLIPKAYNPPANDRIRMSDIYADQYLDVEVPHYKGMDSIHSLKVRWEGRVGYHDGDIVVVGPNPGPRRLRIPRLEVIDNIGGSVTVGYSVKENDDAQTLESQRLTLHIDPQALDLPAPTYSRSARRITVDHADIRTGYKIRVRWTIDGVGLEGPEEDVYTGQPYHYDVPAEWIGQSQDKTTLVNYSVRRTGSSELSMFSRVLRLTFNEPAISDIRDSRGSIAPGGNTAETSVTVTGTASKGERVQLFDANNPVPISAPALADATTGIWSAPLDGLADKLYVLKAKALYGSGLESSERRFTVRAIVAPTLENVKGGDGQEIANNTTTPWPNVILFGRAQANERIRVFDATTVLGTVDVPSSGNWEYPVSRLLSGLHRLRVEALYGSGLPASATRSFTVKLDLLKPSVPKAYNPPARDRLRMSDIYYDEYLEVEVPHYKGMDSIHSLKVRWEGRVDYHDGPVVPVGANPGPRRLRVPRLEVIDNIGASVTVGYSVKENASSETLESQRLTLHIDPQDLNLHTPTYSSAAKRVTVDHADIKTGYKIRVRWTIDGTALEGPEENLSTGQAYHYNVPAAWITQSQGKTVLVNYSVWRTGTTGLTMFSRVLRLTF
ncbi:hypothetical protein J7E47_17145 [Pseudomonas fluorescens]|uniref:Ig-like domain-containing protein n=1 Tax=Pseudomonas fluorescens TaxID=294 RepID=A0A944HJY7_PSEFL|nr:hypothetical protein [Pseudomonas fluorescens]